MNLAIRIQRNDKIIITTNFVAGVIPCTRENNQHTSLTIAHVFASTVFYLLKSSFPLMLFFALFLQWSHRSRYTLYCVGRESQCQPWRQYNWGGAQYRLPGNAGTALRLGLSYSRRVWLITQKWPLLVKTFTLYICIWIYCWYIASQNKVIITMTS